MNEPKWSSIADRIIAIVGLIGSFILVAVLAYEMGAADQRDATPKCKPKVISQMDWYSPEELRRIARARERAR